MLAAVLLSGGCSDNMVPDQADTCMISLSDISFTAGPDGQTFEITVTSSGEWRIAGQCEWCTFSSDRGESGESVALTVDQNDSGSERTASFKFFSGSAVQGITVISSPEYYFEFLTDGDGTHYSRDGGQLIVKYRSNISGDPDVAWSDESASSWIVHERSVNAFGVRSMIFRILENDTYRPRSASMTVSGFDQSVEYEISQDQTDAFFLENEGNTIETRNLEAHDLTVKMKTNIEDIECTDSPSWISTEGPITGETDESGLTELTFVLHIEASGGSRTGELVFGKGRDDYAEFVVKQLNPNPTYVTITDPGLREILEDEELIITDDEESGRCEILSAGMSVENIEIDSYYTKHDIKTISGLGGFPALKSLDIVDCEDLAEIDLSDCSSIENISISISSWSSSCLSSIKLGNNPISSLDLSADPISGSMASESLSVSGSNLTKLDFSNDDGDEDDACILLDVTGCPALKELKATRGYSEYDWDTWDEILVATLKTILLTQEQKDAYDRGEMTIEKSDETEISVRQ